MFFRQQPPLNAARMYLNPETFLNSLGQLFWTECGVFGSQLKDKIHHFAGQLVSSLRTTLVRKQAEDSVLLEGRLRLVEGGAREPEGACRFADGVAVHVNLAQHLVLDLQQVVGIEEIAVLKQGVTDRLGLWIERTVAAKGLALQLAVERCVHAPDHL